MTSENIFNRITFCIGQTGAATGAVNVNIATPQQLLAEIENFIAAGKGFAVATLNLDHVTKLRRQPKFYQAYRVHDLVTADGFPIVWLGRLGGAPLVRTTGSDMLEPILRLAARMNQPIAIVGSQDHVLAKAVKILEARHPGLSVVYCHSPAFGFDPTSEDARRILREVRDSGAAICFIAFGAPKQEIFAAEGRSIAPRVGFVSIGASVDFVAGHQVRAPLWLQKLNLEWLWRLAKSPRRLFWRYAQCAAVFPRLLLTTLFTPSPHRVRHARRK